VWWAMNWFLSREWNLVSNYLVDTFSKSSTEVNWFPETCCNLHEGLYHHFFRILLRLSEK
jgi:hypothetical protein